MTVHAEGDVAWVMYRPAPHDPSPRTAAVIEEQVSRHDAEIQAWLRATPRDQVLVPASGIDPRI